MEQVRHTILDRIADGVGDNREEMNRLKGETGSMEDQALKYMQEHQVHMYRHSGVEFAVVPGGDKLRVRTRVTEGDSEVSGAPTDADREASAE